LASCKTCRYMRGPYEVPSGGPMGEGFAAGWCHRTPPTLSQDLQSASHRPTRLVGWCGEYRWRAPWWFWPLILSLALLAGWVVGNLVGKM